ncbi:ATP-binding protein [Desertivirga xinjiangensis]|uniref:ATP-binding protein n=1 Tax=Desertivirga xinjiangensis TaxID=539206 RepID=UPI00210EE4D0|nr:ATP-binding protein [Pedobacter xinjiangensis]
MSNLLKRVYNKILEKIERLESDPINQARVKMLVLGLAVNLVFCAFTIPIYFFYGPRLQFLRSLVVFTVGLGLIFVVLKWNVWRGVSHTAIALLTLLIWSNLVFYVQGINLPTIQFIFIIIVYSFYAHGLKWGVFYGTVNILPVIIYTVFDGQQYFSLNVSPQKINLPAYLFVVTYNFGLIIYLHYHFFKAFNLNIVKLTEAGLNLKLLNQRLQQSMEEAQRSSRAKMDFLSTMSHELRTPLNGVIGLSNVLLLNSPREDQEENMRILKFSAENLLTLINDILDFNKLNSGKFEMEDIPFNLYLLLQNISAGLRLSAQKKGIQLNLDIDPLLYNKMVYGDPTRLTQVLINLTNNAIKFTDEGNVEIKAEVIEHSDHIMDVRVSVKDTGIGIPQDHQKAIFEPFTQASKSTNRKFGGTGLGLAIVKGILEKLGSQINLISERGTGTEFFFNIKFSCSDTDGDIIPAPAIGNKILNKRTSLGELKILVAEDNPINVMVIKKLFMAWNIQPAAIAQNGIEVLEMVKSNNFHLVLMDLHMPEMDGYEASRQIRQLPDKEKSSVHIIALSASVSEDINSKVRKAGMNDYLPKPFNPKDLQEKLSNLLLMQ